LYDFDTVICRPYTAQSIKQELSKSISKKLNITDADKLFSRCNSLARSKNFLQLSKELSENSIKYSTKTMYLYYQAKVYEYNNLADDAIATLELALSTDGENKLCAFYYIELAAANKIFIKARPYITILLENNFINKTIIVPIIKCCLANKDFAQLFKLYESVKDFELEDDQKIPLAAGLTMACKYYVLKGQGLEHVKKVLFYALKLSCSKNSIISSIYNMLIDLDEYLFVKTQIEKIPSEELGIEIQIVELRVSAITDKSPYLTLEKASTLINKDIRVFDIYEIMIKKSLEVNRDPKFIQRLAYEASKLFPENIHTIDKLCKVL
jgi:hypothetical protein